MIFTPSGNILDGVFSYYNKKNKNKISKFVNVVSIGTYFPDKWSEPSILVTPDSNVVSVSNNWCSPNISSSFVQFAFLKSTLTLSSYTIKSRTINPYDMPYSWKIYGSLDGISFDLLDTKTKRTELIETNQSNYIPDTPNYKLKYFKIEQTINSNSRFYFCLGRIELFGKLIKDEYCSNIKKMNINSPSSVLILILLQSR